MRPFALVRDLSGAFAPKPRARFDCLEIELLMSSHSNFSRLPLSKIAEIDPRNRFFWSCGRVVLWSGGLVVEWSCGRVVGTTGRPDCQTVGPKLVGVTGVEPVTFTLSV